MPDRLKKNSKLHFALIQELYYRNTASCNVLSTATKKSIPLVTKVINDLVEMGYVSERGYAPSSGGRRPLTYSLISDKLFILVVAMDQLSTRIGIVDLHNNYILPLSVVELKLKHNSTAVDELTQHIKDYITKSGISISKFIGIGIGMPGFINVTEGINYTYLETNNTTLKQHLLEEIGIPAYIDNDSSLIALAELKFGAANRSADAMVINMGWGIGLGMIVNGNLFRGHNGFAGEFSHIAITDEDILCSCGKQGCLEAVASLLAVADKAIQGIKNGRISSLSYIKDLNSKVDVGDAILKEANNGDQYAIELITDAAYKIGRALSILIHIMNPKTIVLSGRSVKVAKLMRSPIQQALNKYCIPRLIEDTEIKISELGFDAELIGASILVMQNFGKEKVA
ncbi:MAG: ROK family protein [Pedobacter sp.]|nr:MAG: ROK family protein [Pedobacter sp.]